jgi:carboxypeptidase PM20D1
MLHDKAIKRLSGAIQIKTVSTDDYSQTEFAPFDEFYTYLKRVFPLFFSVATAQIINQYGLLFRLRGANPGLKPMLLLAHYDVVPVGEESK